MLLYLDAENRVIAHNTCISKEEASAYTKKGNAVWVDTPMPTPEINGLQPVLYYSEANGIYFDYIQPTPVEVPLTETQILMQTLADIEINTLQAQQERQLLAQQLADIEIALLSGGELHV